LTASSQRARHTPHSLHLERQPSGPRDGLFGESMIDRIFHWCVDFLEHWAAVLGITYEEINVYLFVIALPIVLVAQFLIIAALLLRNK
jgi:hypothetical protein